MSEELSPSLIDLVRIWAEESGLPVKVETENSKVMLLCVIGRREIRTATIHEREIEFHFNEKNCHDLGKEWFSHYRSSHIISERIHASDTQLFEKLEKLIRSDLSNTGTFYA